MPPHPTSWRSISIISSYISLELPSGLFPSGFPNKILYALLLSPVCAKWPVNLMLLDLSNRIIFGEQYRP
jgi:hypothetical protein